MYASLIMHSQGTWLCVLVDLPLPGIDDMTRNSVYARIDILVVLASVRNFALVKKGLVPLICGASLSQVNKPQ